MSLFGCSLFDGSNTCWSRDLLCVIKMNRTVLSEGGDAVLRSVREGMSIFQLLQYCQIKATPSVVQDVHHVAKGIAKRSKHRLKCRVARSALFS